MARAPETSGALVKQDYERGKRGEDNSIARILYTEKIERQILTYWDFGVSYLKLNIYRTKLNARKLTPDSV